MHIDPSAAKGRYVSVLGQRDTVDSLLANLFDFPYIFRSVYSVYAMPKTAARDIH